MSIKTLPPEAISKKFGRVWDISEHKDVASALRRLQEIYARHTQHIKDAFAAFIAGQQPDLTILKTACYPFLGFHVVPEAVTRSAHHESFGVLTKPGTYGAALTQPFLFASYYHDQLSRLKEHYDIVFYVGVSPVPIPLPFVVDQSQLSPDVAVLDQIRHTFTMPDLKRINDHLADCIASPSPKSHSDLEPLSIFSAERVDFSLQRLSHYTGTAPQHFQNFILLTNYQRYIDTFREWAIDQLSVSSAYDSLVEPGNKITPSLPSEDKSQDQELPPTQGSSGHFQMPAYHLTQKDKQGITLINIGVGPSNAKTITDHLAVLRPHCWLMLGHCGGLRDTLELGDYILAHGYVRLDNVLDENLPNWIPLPPLAEVQTSLQQAIASITGLSGAAFKARVRTGTVATTDNRNWELLLMELMERLRQSRAIAIDMESATVAANGFRFRIPYGTLLCVSDKPIHGEIKLPGLAQAFYRERISQHLFVGIEAIRILKEKGMDRLHSRKLRGFDEPPFR